MPRTVALPKTTQQMLHIMVLDPHAHLKLSPYTLQWYVSARIEQSDGVFLERPTEHRDTPDKAIAAYLQALTSTPSNQYLVTGAWTEERKHWRWSGVAFIQDHIPDSQPPDTTR